MTSMRGERGKTMRRTRMSWALLLIPLLASVACVRLHGPKDLRRELSESAGVRLEREVGFTVTRSGVWLARIGLGMADESPLSLRGVKRVQVGVYHVDGLARGSDQRSPLEVAKLLPDWEPLVRVREGDEELLVLIDERKESIRGLVVIVAEEDEWVLIRIKGKLDRIIEEAISMAFDQAERPDLYARSREERGLDPLPESSENPREEDAPDEAMTVSWQSEAESD